MLIHQSIHINPLQHHPDDDWHKQVERLLDGSAVIKALASTAIPQVSGNPRWKPIGWRHRLSGQSG
jgi:hypothetical protein